MAKLRVDLKAPRGPAAARLRHRKHVLRRQFRLPDDLDEMLPGALTLTHLRCGKPTCHCATGAGHPAWHLTVRVDGRTRVIHIPATWVDAIRRQVDAGRAFQDAVREVLAANAQLLVLVRQQRRR
jgi:hypothetical protein